MAQKEKNKKIVLGIIIAILFVGVGVGCYFLLGKTVEENQVSERDDNNGNTEVIKTTSVEKTNETTTKIEESEVEKEDGIEVIDESDPNNSSFVTGVISYSGFKGDKYRITVVTEQALSEGECSLSLDGKTVLSGIEVVAHPNSASCTFDLDEIGEGKFEVEVLVATTGGREGTIKGEIEVER